MTTITEGLMATPAHRSPALESVVAVAPFRAWRGSQHIVAGRPTGATTEPQKDSALFAGTELCRKPRQGSIILCCFIAFNHSLKGGG
jgi:hypothetical protein